MLFSIPPLLTLVCYLTLGLFTRHRGLKTRVDWLLFLICISGTLLYLDILIIFNTPSRSIALFSSRLDHCFVAFTIPLFIHFFHVYFKIVNKRWVLVLAYSFAVLMVPFAFTPYLIAEMHLYRFGFFGSGGPLYPLIGAGALLAVLYCLTIIGTAIRREKISIQKNKLKYLLVGFGTMGILNGLNVVPILGYPVYPPGTFSFVPLMVFGVGLFKYDLLDMGVILKKSLLYSVMTALLICIFSLAVALVNKALSHFLFDEPLMYTLAFFLIVAAIFGPIKMCIQKYLDRVFYRKKYSYQSTIKDLGQTIASTLDVEEIAAHLSNTVVEKVMLTHCRLFLKDRSGFACVAQRWSSPGWNNAKIRFSPTSSLIVFMKKNRKPAVKRVLLDRFNNETIAHVVNDMETISAEIVLPLTFNCRFRGFIGLGQKKSGELFSGEDINLLVTLSVQTALAIENALSYKGLGELNKTLEFQVEKRTRALRQALLEKEKTQDQLIRSESLAAIGQLVAGTAHELNNPLSSSISLVQSTIEDLEKWGHSRVVDGGIIADLVFAEKELGRAKSIISSLLGLSRQTRVYTESVDLNAVVKDALKVLNNQYKHQNLTIETRFDVNLPRIPGNFSSLGQVVINIINNAIQSVAPTGGKILISTSREAGKDRVVFACDDTGSGMDNKILKDVFKPFFTTKEVGKGTGLGLYICHEIVKKHCGCITVSSRPGKGAHFKVKLPVSLNKR